MIKLEGITMWHDCYELYDISSIYVMALYDIMLWIRWWLLWIIWHDWFELCNMTVREIYGMIQLHCKDTLAMNFMICLFWVMWYDCVIVRNDFVVRLLWTIWYVASVVVLLWIVCDMIVMNCTIQLLWSLWWLVVMNYMIWLL